MNDIKALGQFLNDKLGLLPLLEYIFIDPNLRIEAGKVVLENFEDCVEEGQETQLKSMIDDIIAFLNKTNVEHVQERPNHKIRLLCLDILHKVPASDSMKNSAISILSLCFKLLEFENEEISIRCTKILLDFHKNYRLALNMSNDVYKFLIFAKRVYKEYQAQIDKIFISPNSFKTVTLENFDIETNLLDVFCIARIETNEFDENDEKKIYHLLPKACFSLRLMQELPVLIAFMHQVFKNNIQKEMNDLIPLLLDFINLQPSDEIRRHPRFSNVLFFEFMAAQTKTVSFLAYTTKNLPDLNEKHTPQLVEGMEKLLINIPPRITNIRKEFFVAARHILSVSEIRPKFLNVLEKFMDERILVGSGNVVRDILRPLAFSTMADLIHHIRTDLSLSTIANAIDLFGRNLFDITLPFSIRQMSLKLLLNIIDCIRQKASYVQKHRDNQVPINNSSSAKITTEFVGQLLDGSARRLLAHALAIFVRKCKMVIDTYLPTIESHCLLNPPPILKKLLGKPNLQTDVFPAQMTAVVDSPNLQFLTQAQKTLFAVSAIGVLGGAPIETTCPKDTSDNTTPWIFESFLDENATLQQSQQQMTYVDIRLMVKSLINGIRTAVNCLLLCPHVSAENDAETQSSRQLNQEETQLLSEYLVLSFRLIDIVQIVLRDGSLYHKSPQSLWKHPDEKNIFDHLVYTFAQLNNVSFHEIFSQNIHEFVECCVKAPSFITVAQNLSINPVHTSNLAHILLGYLVKRLDQIGDGSDRALIYTKLFKMVFNTVNLRNTENEFVIKQYLRRIVQGSMQLCLTDRDPTAYLTLLRTLFRSIGGGSHDKLYREFFPFLPEMLTSLNRLLRSPHRAFARDLLSELCVIVPVRLSSLMPHLNLLMEPLVYVLNCNTANQGLRTLELCVDNLPQDFLYQHLHCLKEDFIQILYNFFYSPLEIYHKTAFKVLGKLGRFNRADLNDILRLRLDPCLGESGPTFTFHLNESDKAISLPIQVAIRYFVYASLETLQDPSADLTTKKHTWAMLKATSLSHIKSQAGSPDHVYGLLTSPQFKTDILDRSNRHSCQCREKLDLNAVVTMKSFSGLLLLTKEEQQSIDSDGFVKEFVQFGAAVSLLEAAGMADSAKPLSHLLLDSFCYVIGHEDKGYTLSALECVKTLFQTQKDILQELLSGEDLEELICDLPLYKHLAFTLEEMLYHNSWFVKWGACALLRFLFKFLSDAWFVAHFKKIFWGLLNAIHELTSQMSQGSLDFACECCQLLVSRLHQSDRNLTDFLLIELLSGMNSFVNTPEIRKQCRGLVRLVLKQGDHQLSLQSIKQSRLSELLVYTHEPLQSAADSARIKDLPLMVQHCVLEAYHFLGPGSDGLNLIKLDDSFELDRNFLADLQELLKKPDYGRIINLPGLQNNVLSGAAVQQANSKKTAAATPLPPPATKFEVTYLGSMELCTVACQILSSTHYLKDSVEDNFLALFNAIWLSAEPAFHEVAFASLSHFLQHVTLDHICVKACIKPVVLFLKSTDTKFTRIDMQKMCYTIKLFPQHFSSKFTQLIMVRHL
ncbi:hypothetical protein Ciccas_004557 [Cichlidogyrus casuarinus]|uniref:Transformation/transcription domain-associated protein n=1 Tax=Cichlidogyrus casuarinus TaxID=1844966 RepID=A0ABD2QBA2_9PLAT